MGYGVKGRSGARSRFKDFSPSEPAPELDPTNYDSLLAYLAWIAREQAAGNIDRADARELRDTVKAISVVKKARFGERELEDLKALVSQAREDRKRGKENAIAARYGRTGKAEQCPAPNGATSSTKSAKPTTPTSDS